MSWVLVLTIVLADASAAQTVIGAGFPTRAQCMAAVAEIAKLKVEGAVTGAFCFQQQAVRVKGVSV